jgi:exopolyphosphatase/guanosine-5'-triphosphate,3'-diphosphate pyrophosphatase
VNIRILELGSNSFQLHGFEISPAGLVRGTWSAKNRVGLAKGVSPDGLLDLAYVERGLRAVEGLLEASADDTPLVCVATSAVREARNRARLLEPLAQRYGITAHVLSGDDEARLAYSGALSTLESQSGRICVIDIGGGSTEVALGDERGVHFTASARVGALLGDGARGECERLLAPILRRVRMIGAERLIFASGNGRALQRLLVGHGLVDAGASISTRVAEGFLPTLETLSLEALERCGVSQDRAATLVAGTQLMVEVAGELDVAMFDVSQGGLREGVALNEWRRLQAASFVTTTQALAGGCTVALGSHAALVAAPATEAFGTTG